MLLCLVGSVQPGLGPSCIGLTGQGPGEAALGSKTALRTSPVHRIALSELLSAAPLPVQDLLSECPPVRKGRFSGLSEHGGPALQEQGFSFAFALLCWSSVPGKGGWQCGGNVQTRGSSRTARYGFCREAYIGQERKSQVGVGKS